MGNFRFYRRVHIFPGLSVNLSKSGPSLTVGMRGAHMTFGGRGVTRTVGIPGTGVYYTSRAGYHSGVHSAHTETPLAPGAQSAADWIGVFVLLAMVAIIALIIGVAIGSASH
ncbi:MAG: DUF4236 domain-containing protein [Candidatus Acidiferrales bacterium]